ncbi:MAG: CHASE2 domain-containing protein [Planctomycetota bacterium]
MSDKNTIQKSMQGLGSTIVRAGERLRKARVSFGRAHEKRSRYVNAVITVVFTLLVTSLLVYRGDGPAATDYIEAPFKNARYLWLEDPAERDSDIVVIAIDERALAYGDSAALFYGKDQKANAEPYSWPWPRHVYNKIIRYCRAAGAKAVVFDMIYSESGGNTNDPFRWVHFEGRPSMRLWTGDKAGDDLFMLEATARDDVVIALASDTKPRELEERDELLKRYATPLDSSVDGDAVAQDMARLKGTSTPFSALLDGIPPMMTDIRDKERDRQIGEMTGYYRQLEEKSPVLSNARFRSITPLPKPQARGVAGVGMVAVENDAVDGAIRQFRTFGMVEGKAYLSLAVESWRIWVLQSARTGDADKFAKECPGMTLEDGHVVIGDKRYAIENNLRDVPLTKEEDEILYLGRRIPVDETAQFQMRYRLPIRAEDDPLWRINKDDRESIKESYKHGVIALYPTVSAADVLSDWDAAYANSNVFNLARREKLLEEIAETQEYIEYAEPEELEELNAQLTSQQQALAAIPEKPETIFELSLGEPSELMKDKIVFIAGAAAGLGDRHKTPASATMPGTYVVANAFDNVKNDDFLRASPNWLRWLMALVGGLLAVLAVMFSGKIWKGVGLVALLATAVVISGMVGFSMQWWLPMAAPLVGVSVGFLEASLAKALTESRQRRQRESFAKQYMGKELVDHVIKNPGSLALGGENREMSVYFSDVAGFTTVTEVLGTENPERLVELLNVYLERMTDVMLETGGVIDKYIGDAIMCFWGAPMSQEDHAQRACMGALNCRTELNRMQPLFIDAVKEIAPQLIKPDGTVLYARAGINSGLMTVGNMGSSKRFAYTVMGDAVNLAARLEPQNKPYGTDIMIGQKTEAMIRGEFTIRPLDLIVVKGKTEPVEVFELLGEKEVPGFVADLVKDFNQGIELFRAQEFAEALKAFNASAKNESRADTDEINPSKLYIERCEDLIANPPDKDWNGVFVKTSK